MKLGRALNRRWNIPLTLVRSVCRTLTFFLVIVCGMGLSGNALGQARPDEPVEKSANGGSAVTDTGVETIYVRDADGDLVPVLNMSYEDFLRLYNLDRELTQPEKPPSFTIEELIVTGNEVANRAELDIQLRIKLLTDEMVRVPLRLKGAVLNGRAVYDGNGEHTIQSAEAKSGGYVSWLRGDPMEKHTLKFKVLAPIFQVGQQSRLELTLPRAASSRLEFVAGVPNGSATVSQQAQLVDKELLGENRTRFVAAGIAGDFQITWGNLAVAAKERPRIVEVDGDIQVLVKGPGAVSTEARLRVSSFSGEMQSLRIRLPVGSKPIAVENSEYSVEFVTNERADNQPNRPIAIVKFNQPTKGPIDVQLAVEQNVARPSAATGNSDELKSGQAIDVLGFEVADAVRHSGTVSLVADGDWLVRWDEQANLRRIAVDNQTLSPGKLTAAFQYYRQPSALPISIKPKETRVIVDPTYFFDVREDAVEMTADLNFKIRGAPASFLHIDLAGWEVIDVGDPSLIQEDSFTTSDVAPLEIPLAVPKRGDFSIKVRAIRPIDISTKLLTINLPVVQEATASPALVMVSPADNLTLSGKPQSVRSFDTEPAPDSLKSGDRERKPLCYRYRGEAASGSLQYDIGLKERAVNVRINNLVEVTRDAVKLTQDFRFNVRYLPVDVLSLTLPKRMIESDTFRLELGDKEVDPSARRIFDDAEDGQMQRLEVRLPQSRTGDIRLQARVVELADGSNRFNLPAATTTLGEVSETVLQISPNSSSIGVTLQDSEDWTAQVLSNPGSDSVWKSSIQPNQIAVETRFIRSESRQPAVIERLFAQTWMTNDERQDRAVVNLSMASSPLRFRLPDGAVVEKSRAIVDGKPVTIRDAGDAWLEVDIDAARNQTTVEFFYPFRQRTETGQMKLELPEIERAGWTRSIYWHLVLPGHEHLLVGPSSLQAEHRWRREGLVIARRLDRDQGWLEEFAQGSSQDAPDEEQNQYLFSGFGESPSMTLRTASRKTLLFWASGLCLIVGMLWKIVSSLPLRWMLFPIFVFAAAAAWLNPSTTLVVLQAAAFGLVLLALARILDWMINRSPAPATVVNKPISDVVTSRTALNIGNSNEVPSLASTDTAIISLPTSES